MVSIFACGASTCLSVPAWAGFAFENWGVAPCRALIPLLLFPQYLYSQSYEPGSITTSSPNEFGEKSCWHHNVKGTVFNSGGISLDTPHPSYANTKRLVTQHIGKDGRLVTVPYTTFATLSSVLEEKDTGVYVKVYDRYNADRVFDQSITWKRYKRSIYASYKIAHYESYNPRNGRVLSRSWIVTVALYDYKEFPKAIYATFKTISGSGDQIIPTFEEVCSNAVSSLGLIVDPLEHAWIAQFNDIASPANTFQRVQYELRSICHDPLFSLRFNKEPAVEWGDLCEEAINDCHALDLNSIALTRDLLCLVPELKALSTLLSSLTRASRFATLYLSYRYGLPLTIQDTKRVMQRVHDLRDKAVALPVSIVRSESKASVRPCGGALSSVSTKQWYKIYYRPIDGRVMSIFRSLLDWDIYPTFQNLWDLVPFSFVVDWFIDVESLMNKMDTNMYIPYLDVLAVTRTRKDSCTVSTRDLGVSGSGSLTISLYEREVLPTLDQPRLKLDQPKKFRNWAELTAIIVQKVR